jgi:hypothetical protein
LIHYSRVAFEKNHKVRDGAFEFYEDLAPALSAFAFDADAVDRSTSRFLPAV